jgi:excisionase family DNA binding protein
MKLTTTTQAAEQLGISPAGVRKLVQRGKLKASMFGGVLAFRPADIERAKGRPKPGRPKGVAK